MAVQISHETLRNHADKSLAHLQPLAFAHLRPGHMPPARKKKNSVRGLAHYGTVHAPSGFRPRAKPVPMPFKDIPGASPRQGSLLDLFRGAKPRPAAPPTPQKAPAAPQPPSTPATQRSNSKRPPLPMRPAALLKRSKQEQVAAPKPPVRAVAVAESVEAKPKVDYACTYVWRVTDRVRL
tara:strand:+ start:279 stop:818 length:540 start_codon:yes stop_codon:yes gene_type:complete